MPNLTNLRLLAGIATVLLVPIILEMLFLWLSGQQVDARRAIIAGTSIFCALMVILVVALVLGGFSRYLTLVLIIQGFLTAIAGIWTVDPRLQESLIEEAFAGTVLLVVGVAEIVTGLVVAVELTRGAYIPLNLREEPVRGDTKRDGDVISMMTRRFDERLDRKMEDLVRQALSYDGLHFVAYYSSGHLRFTSDILNDDRLDVFFTREHGRDEQRRRYEVYGRRTRTIMRRLDTYFKDMDSGILIRTVLDVEQGALYVFHVDHKVFVTGVTMRQSQVHRADADLAALVDRIRQLRGQPPITTDMPA